MADEPRRTEDLQEEEPVEKIDLGASLRKEHKAKKPVNRLAVLVTAGAVIVLAAVLAIFLPGLLNQEEENVQTESQAVALSDHVTEDVVSIHIDGENTFTITTEEVTAEDGTADEVFHVDIWTMRCSTRAPARQPSSTRRTWRPTSSWRPMRRISRPTAWTTPPAR